jgi:hypothetical protein
MSQSSLLPGRSRQNENTRRHARGWEHANGLNTECVIQIRDRRQTRTNPPNSMVSQHLSRWGLEKAGNYRPEQRRSQGHVERMVDELLVCQYVEQMAGEDANRLNRYSGLRRILAPFTSPVADMYSMRRMEENACCGFSLSRYQGRTQTVWIISLVFREHSRDA